MSYADNSAPPPAPLPGRSVKPAPHLPAAGKPTLQSMTVTQLSVALHGEAATRHAAAYASNLRNALRLEAEITEAGADEEGGWLHLTEEIKSAADSYLTAADMVLQLSGMKSALINPGLLLTMPAPVLARLVAAGLQCMAEDLLDLIEVVHGTEEGPATEDKGGPEK